MSTYKINSTGNIILADKDFMDAVHPNDYTLVPDITPPVVVNTKLSKVEFIKRFTPTEYAAIKTAAAANGVIDYYWQLLMVAEFVDTSDPTTIAGITALETAGLLATGRAAQILT